MDRLILALKARILVPVVLLLGFVIWGVLCNAHYESYWNGTIYRVQTVDFNILHHTLPTTLSELLIAGRDDLVQQVLDSTYGIFGIVVTTPSGDSVLYKTSRAYHHSSWPSLATPEVMVKSQEPYDLLTDPPPMAAEYEHKSPRESKASRLVIAPAGRVLGRIYYVRPLPPTLINDLSGFFGSGILELSGAKRGYLFITLSMIGFSLAIILLVLWRKRGLELKQIELDHLQKDLEVRQKALDHLTAELLAQKMRKQWLEREADQAYRRALNLKESLEKLKKGLALETEAPNNTMLQQAGAIKVRPPVHPPSALLQEIESLIPSLNNDAQALKAQASQLQDHCLELEARQSEMKRILDQAYVKASNLTPNLLQFRTR